MGHPWSLRPADNAASGVSLVFACRDIDRSLQAVTEAGVVVTHPLSQGHWGAKIAGFEDPEGQHHLSRTAKR